MKRHAVVIAGIACCVVLVAQLTNRWRRPVTVPQAIAIASSLWVGMTEEQAEAFLARHNLKPDPIRVGCLHGWTIGSDLADGCKLGIEIGGARYKTVTSADGQKVTQYEGPLLLETAMIYSNSVKIADITLRERP